MSLEGIGFYEDVYGVNSQLTSVFSEKSNLGKWVVTLENRQSIIEPALAILQKITNLSTEERCSRSLRGNGQTSAGTSTTTSTNSNGNSTTQTEVHVNHNSGNVTYYGRAQGTTNRDSNGNTYAEAGATVGVEITF